MASRFVHAVHSLIAYGLPYAHVHAKKDSFSQWAPGLPHRAVRHRRYRRLRVGWTLADAYPAEWERQVERVGRWKGDVIAEEYMVAAAHEVDDRVWDFDGRSRTERAAVRKYWEGFCAWLIFHPEILKSWAGVDVVTGYIHRVIGGLEVWEFEPDLVTAYQSLRRHAYFLFRVDRQLREVVQACGGIDPLRGRAV